MLGYSLRPAREDELPWVWPAVRAAHLFETAAQLETHWREAPWRVQVSEKREAALLARWREHMDVLAVRGLWCAERRVPQMMEALASVARAHGFRRLLSPLVAEEASAPYRAAGMRTAEAILALRLDRPEHAVVALPDDVHLRLGGAPDIDTVLALDATAFPEFWRYDRSTLDRYVNAERFCLAEVGERVIGYTLCTASGPDGTLGRLAVDPAWQGRGVGAALLSDSLSYLARQGVRSVTLSTQVDNAVSRRLYARAGFRELAGRLLFLVSEDLSQP